MTDWADFEIIGEIEVYDTHRKVMLNCIASIDDEGYMEKTLLSYPLNIDTYNKLAIHVSDRVVSPWFDGLRYVPPVETECPIDGTPLQNGECMVCGWKVI